MDMSGILQDARMEKIPDIIGIRMQAATRSFNNGLSSWTSHIPSLAKRTETIRQIKTSLTADAHIRLDIAFRACAANEPVVTGFLTPPTELEDEGYAQHLFRGEYTKPLNYIPHILAVWSILKIFVFPAMSVMVPLVTLVAPFIVLKFVMKLPITVSEYFRITKELYLGGGASALMAHLNVRMPQLPAGMSDTAKSWVQVGVVVFSLAQAVWQPIQGARHTWRLQEMILEKARGVQAFLAAAEQARAALADAGIRTPRLPIPEGLRGDLRRLVAFCLDRPKLVELLLGQVGRLEVIYRLAASKDVVPVCWVGGDSPHIFMSAICDIGIAPAARRPFNVGIGPGTGGGHTGQHALLTGPNRGGKSTALRAVLRNVVLAHTYGVAFGAVIEMTPLAWVQSCLRLEDLPGKASLFEREVAFAATSLARANAGPGLGMVFIDELFHSTNPPDAAAASHHYLNKLWACPNVASMISTHVFELVTAAPAFVQRLCCPATELADGRIQYHYGLKQGICTVSSVGDILRENGL
jgi:hypothetical protein